MEGTAQASLAGEALSSWPPLAIADHVVWVDVEGDLVLFDSRESKYHSLDAAASAIWRCIAAGVSPADIVAALEGDYAADEGEVAVGVREFLQEAIGLGLLDVDAARG
jgi:hypothetical protein